MPRARRGYRCPKCGYPGDDLVARKICDCPECGVTFVHGRRRHVPSYIPALYLLIAPFPVVALVLSLTLGGVSMFGTPATIEAQILLVLGFLGAPGAFLLLSCFHRRRLGDDSWLLNGLLLTGTVLGINILVAVPVYVCALLIIASAV